MAHTNDLFIHAMSEKQTPNRELKNMELCPIGDSIIGVIFGHLQLHRDVLQN